MRAANKVRHRYLVPRRRVTRMVRTDVRVEEEMKGIISIVLCACVCGCAGTQQQSAMTSRLQLQDARLLFNQHDWTGASAIYTRLTAADHVDQEVRTEAMYYRGMCYEKTREYTKAIDTWEALVKQFAGVSWLQGARLWRLQLRIAALLFRQKAWLDASKIYCSLIAGKNVDPEVKSEAMYYGGYCYEEMGDYVNALDTWQALYHEFPDTPWVKWGGPLRGRKSMTERAERQKKERSEQSVGGDGVNPLPQR